MNLNDFTIQKNMIFNDCHDIFRYSFWQCFLKCFGIDSVSLFGTLSASMLAFWGARF